MDFWEVTDARKYYANIHIIPNGLYPVIYHEAEATILFKVINPQTAYPTQNKKGLILIWIGLDNFMWTVYKKGELLLAQSLKSLLSVSATLHPELKLITSALCTVLICFWVYFDVWDCVL